MHVPAWPVLPSSTLAQNQIAEKFNVSALAGLGMEICNEETCYDDGSGAGGSPGGVESVNLPYMQDTGAAGWPGTPFGTAVNVPTAGGTTITYVNRGSQSAPNYQPVIGAAVQGAIDLAKLFAITPGTVQQGGTTLKQNPGFAVPLPATNTGVSLKANTGSSLIIAAAAVGIAALFLFNKGKG